MKALLYRNILGNKVAIFWIIIMSILGVFVKGNTLFFYFYLLVIRSQIVYTDEKPINEEHKRFMLMPISKVDYIKEYFLSIIIYITLILAINISLTFLLGKSFERLPMLLKLVINLLGINGMLSIILFGSPGFIDGSLKKAIYSAGAIIFALYVIFKITYGNPESMDDFIVESIILIIWPLLSYIYLIKKEGEKKWKD